MPWRTGSRRRRRQRKSRYEAGDHLYGRGLLRQPRPRRLGGDPAIRGAPEGALRRAKGWVKGDKKPALNPDLWETLLELCEVHQVRTHWVKGHSTNPFNNRCDQLAVSEWQKLK